MFGGIEVGIKIATSASVLYSDTARRMAIWAREIDRPVALDHDEPERRADEGEQLLSVSLSAVMAAALAVEASLNEFYMAHRLGMSQNFGRLDEQLAQRLSEAWDAGASRLNPLEKADLAYVIAHLTPIEWGRDVALRRADL